MNNHVRIVQTTDPDHDFGVPEEDLNEHLMEDVYRGTAGLVIQDAVRDNRGNIMQTVNGLGTIQRSKVDGLGRQLESYYIEVANSAEVEHLKTTTAYDSYGNTLFTTSPSKDPVNNPGSKTQYTYSPVGTGYVSSMTVAFDESDDLEATTQYEYDESGRRTATIPPGPDGNPDPARKSSIDYDESCCGQFMANIDALGNARISRRNSAGENIHSAVVEDWSQYNVQSGARPTQLVMSESTSSYLPDGKMEFQTRWKDPLANASGNSLPIAGVDAPAIEGVTTRYIYDYDLSDNSGLNSMNGQSFGRLDGTNNGTVNLEDAIAKLAMPTSSGGGGITFGDIATGNAVAIVSPDEKVVRFSISDGVGRSVMTGLLSGPAADVGATGDEPSTPNELLDWTITAYDDVTTASGQATVVNTKAIDRDGGVRTSTANGVGWAIASVDESGFQTDSAFNDAGIPLNIKQYDLSSQTVQEMSYVYDFMGRKIQSTDNTLNLTTETRYDDYGRVEEQEDAKDKSTHQDYDILNRPTVLTDRLNQITTRAYNVPTSGNEFINTVTDAEGNTTTYTMDLLGRRKFIDLANEQRTAFEYDAAGRRSEIKYFADKDDQYPIARREYAYEKPSGVLDRIEYYDVDTVGGETLVSTDKFDYNEVLQRDEATQHAGNDQTTPLHTLAWDYTLRGQIHKETTTYDGQIYVVENQYDDRGRVKKIAYPSANPQSTPPAGIVEYTYTPRGEVDLIKWNDAQIEDRGYTALGQLETIARTGISGTETRDYTGRRLDQIDATNMGIGTIDYGYDLNLNKESEDFSNSRLNKYDFDTGTNGYDDEDRFTKFNRPNFTTGGETATFIRSAPSGASGSIGNIIDIDGGIYDGERDFNTIHQLGGFGTATPTQTFDGAGNLTLSDSGTALGWDVAAGRMTSADVTSDPSGIQGDHNYGYDAIGRRAWKEVNDETDTNAVVTTKTVYVYSGLNCIAEYDSGDVATQPGNQYVYAGGIDSLAMLVTPGTGSQKLAAVRNQQWSIVGLVDIDTSSLEELYAYNVFGERTIINPSDGTVLTVNTFNNPYGYTSQRHDDETGLMYFKARYYNNKKGLFLSLDPLGVLIGSELFHDGFSLYRGYLALAGIDPLGTKWKIVRSGKAWAEAIPESGQESIEDLAIHVKLNVSEYSKWLKISSPPDITRGRIYPKASVVSQWCGLPTFKVPNHWAVFQSQRTFRDLSLAAMQCRGLAVNSYFRAQQMGFKVTFGYKDKVQFISLWKLNGIYAFTAGGHGAVEGFEIPPYDSDNQLFADTVSPFDVAPPYKLARIAIFSCHSADLIPDTNNSPPRPGRYWRYHLSNLGEFVGHEGPYNIWQYFRTWNGPWRGR